MRNSQSRQAARDSSESRPDGFDGQVQKEYGRGRAKRDQDRTGDFSGVLQAINHRGNRKDGHGGLGGRKNIISLPQNHPSTEENTKGANYPYFKKNSNFRA